MSEVRAKALIMIVSRPDAVEVAIEKIGPEITGYLFAEHPRQDRGRASGLEDRARFPHDMIDSRMNIRDFFGRFEYLLGLLVEEGYTQEDVVLDSVGGTTPIRLWFCYDDVRAEF